MIQHMVNLQPTGNTFTERLSSTINILFGVVGESANALSAGLKQTTGMFQGQQRVSTQQNQFNNPDAFATEQDPLNKLNRSQDDMDSDRMLDLKRADRLASKRDPDF